MNENKKRMTDEEMYRFIDSICRAELEEEVKELKNTYQYPRYLKAVRVTLVSLGYDVMWVDGHFRTALEKKYL